jgi:RNase P subunit RPR2
LQPSKFKQLFQNLAKDDLEAQTAVCALLSSNKILLNIPASLVWDSVSYSELLDKLYTAGLAVTGGTTQSMRRYITLMQEICQFDEMEFFNEHKEDVLKLCQQASGFDNCVRDLEQHADAFVRPEADFVVAFFYTVDNVLSFLNNIGISWRSRRKSCISTDNKLKM